MSFKNIVVPVDFSEFSDRAVDCALFLAEKHSAHLTLVHAIVLFQEDILEESHLHDYEGLVKKKEDASHRLMQDHNQAADERGVSIDSKIIRGFSAADAILDFISENGFDLVVMGTHGRTGLKKWIYGSVAEKIVRLSPIPVLTTLKETKEPSFKRILVPVDFSRYSKKAIDFAISFGKEYGALIEFIHIIDQSFHPSYHAIGVSNIFEIDPDLPERSKDKLKEFVAVKSDKVRHVVIPGRPDHEIVEYAKKNEADLIIMATRGLTGLDHILLGSTTERVVRLSPCPVLTIERDR